MKIGACIITYNPNIIVLSNAIESLLPQVDKLIIVDNGSSNKAELESICNEKSVFYISLEDNKGIATATNVALTEFLNQDFDFVLTSDQDSSYPSNYIELFKEDKILLNDNNIAAYAPIFFDENENDYSKIIIPKKVFMKGIVASQDFTDVYHAIASGLIINLSVLKEIGMMNEDLFIDWVDLEWCWKARFYGKRIVCCKNLQIRHKLGDKSKDIGFRKVSLRSWVRNYYITRNSFYLSLHTDYLKWFDKIILFFKSFRYIVGYTVLCKDHIKNLKYTIKGMQDGIHGRLGKLNPLD